MLNATDKRHQYWEHQDWISEHLDQFFEESEMNVYHEIMTMDFQMDIYHINPKEQPYNILLTSGMSLMEMAVDERHENPDDIKFAELLITIPKSYVFGDFVSAKTDHSWIQYMLKLSARFAHHHDTWLEIGHTLQHDADMIPYSEHTEFVGCAILPSLTLGEEFLTIEREGRKINFYNLFPLYQNELEHKIEHGFGGLVDLLNTSDVPEIFDNDRPNMMD